MGHRGHQNPAHGGREIHFAPRKPWSRPGFLVFTLSIKNSGLFLGGAKWISSIHGISGPYTWEDHLSKHTLGLFLGSTQLRIRPFMSPCWTQWCLGTPLTGPLSRPVLTHENGFPFSSRVLTNELRSMQCLHKVIDSM